MLFRSADDMKNAVQDLESQGAMGYVIDLRDDTGGYLKQAVQIISLFQNDGTVVEIDSRTEGMQKEQASGQAICDKPLTLLVNGYSASASEIMASSLHDNGRANLVGTQTYGKGSVQTISELSFGGAIKYTIAHYRTAGGEDIEGVGVTPDTVVEMDSSLIGSAEADVQYQIAMENCRAKIDDVSSSLE